MNNRGQDEKFSLIAMISYLLSNCVSGVGYMVAQNKKDLPLN